VAQLTSELFHRHPQTKGASNKSKPWFLEQLGEKSIWTTAPHVINQDLSGLPTVTANLTVAQLTHELMSRAATSPTSPSLTKGLSTKTKADLLKLVGLGSIWTTGVGNTPSSSVTKKEPTPGKDKSSSAVKQRAAPVVVAKTTNTKRPLKPDAAHSSVSSNTTSGISSSSTVTSSNTKLVCATLSSSEGTNQKEVQERNMVGTTKNKEETKKVSKNECAKRKSCFVINPDLPTKMARREGTPLVHADMTIAQLKDELKAREPEIKGISSKKKDWFLNRLGLATELQGSKEYQAKMKDYFQRLHIHSSRCHVHPLADTTNLKAPRGTGADGRYDMARHRNGTCNVNHHSICIVAAFRTCERCNWDVCEACFEIESLPTEKQRNDVLRNSRVVLVRQQTQMSEERDRQRRAEMERIQQRVKFMRKRSIETSDSYTLFLGY
jgi:hypothetical protein